MSSTNRGSSYDVLGTYYTPAVVARALTRLLPIHERDFVLEPHVGGGAFAVQIRNRGCGRLHGCDLDPQAAGLALCDRHFVCDFLDFDQPGEDDGYDWVIGNPPYARPERNTAGEPTGRLDAKGHLVMEPAAALHVEHALEVGRHVAFLLRLSMLESAERAEMWKKWPLHKVWVLTRRPSFDSREKKGHGSDSTAYGWFWFERGWSDPPQIDWIDWKAGGQ